MLRNSIESDGANDFVELSRGRENTNRKIEDVLHEKHKSSEIHLTSDHSKQCSFDNDVIDSGDEIDFL